MPFYLEVNYVLGPWFKLGLNPADHIQQASVLTLHRCYHGFRKGSLFMLEELVSVKTNAV